MERVVRLGQKAAASNIPILIEGESGVGKELIARAIQGTGDRRRNPSSRSIAAPSPRTWSRASCSATRRARSPAPPRSTPASSSRRTRGTLFLDEIGDLPLDVQVKLLRAVQDGEVDPVGARSTLKVDIRLISATHRNLLQQVKDGKFREDLFYRLNVFPIFVPPLRERRDDIPYLVRHFVGAVGRRRGRAALKPLHLRRGAGDAADI